MYLVVEGQWEVVGGLETVTVGEGQDQTGTGHLCLCPSLPPIPAPYHPSLLLPKLPAPSNPTCLPLCLLPDTFLPASPSCLTAFSGGTGCPHVLSLSISFWKREEGLFASPCCLACLIFGTWGRGQCLRLLIYLWLWQPACKTYNTPANNSTMHVSTHIYANTAAM